MIDVDQFARRLMVDALLQGDATYRQRRAVTLLAALPRAGDYLGQSTAEAREDHAKALLADAAALLGRGGPPWNST